MRVVEGRFDERDRAGDVPAYLATLVVCVFINLLLSHNL
jgi:hypothetical protein